MGSTLWKCLKWKMISTQEEFEEIRSRFIDELFYREKEQTPTLLGMTTVPLCSLVFFTGYLLIQRINCEGREPALIFLRKVSTAPPHIWAIDKPNQPKTITGYKRVFYLRKDYSEMDAYYVTPSRKRLRSITEVGTFLQQNSEFSDLSVSDSDLRSPKLWMTLYPLVALNKCVDGAKILDSFAV
ncbi:methyl-CpG-binding domain-containing protein 4-like [Lycium ferocissimum]|uniref:methyl-CpG-binding domain-containing protein 4-like n=1 Tax=Lycium ferocissimum TaxID=112874 RepID=UPI00281579CC|nr:methyl-CpG-binding domain-containing protein 4-like [Lycium ferocissimum]